MQSLAESALALARAGYHVFPLVPGTKRPLTQNGFKDASADESLVREWWIKHPDANIGLSCSASGIVVVDIDCHPNDPDGRVIYGSLAGYEADNNVPQALTAQGGGMHLFYAAPSLAEKERFKKNIADSVQIITNGYVVVAPSVYRGQKYAWADGRSLHELNPPAFPEWLRQHVIASVQPKATQSKCPPFIPSVPRDLSDREKELVSQALSFISADDYHIWLQTGMALKTHNFSVDVWIEWSRRSDKFEEEECIRKWATFNRLGVGIGTIFFYAKQSGFSFPAGSYTLDEIGNAARFVNQYGHVVRYLDSAKTWLVYDGTRWKPDEKKTVLSFAKATTRSIAKEAAGCEEPTLQKALLRWANSSCTVARITAMLTLAQLDLAVVADELDREPYLINCLNGTLDLITGRLHSHQPSDLITKLVPVAYDPSAKAPRFEKFLNEVFADSSQVIGFLQCALGSALTGSVKDQQLFVCIGEGQNGKSTLFNCIRDVLGDYAQETDPLLLINKNFNGGATEDVYRLRGIRFATTVETDEDVRLNESRVKQLTGGDRLVARPLYGRHVEFNPTHKLFLITNHRPRIRSQSYSMWRRIRIIEFTVQIADSRKDRHLSDKLKQEHAGVLAWMVRGCQKWLVEGLPESSAVETATNQYRECEDTLQNFIDDCCALDPVAEIAYSVLREAYKSWCRRNGENELNRNEVTKVMRSKGFSERQTNSHKMWKGLSLAGSSDFSAMQTRSC